MKISLTLTHVHISERNTYAYYENFMQLQTEHAGDDEGLLLKLHWPNRGVANKTKFEDFDYQNINQEHRKVFRSGGAHRGLTGLIQFPWRRYKIWLRAYGFHYSVYLK